MFHTAIFISYKKNLRTFWKNQIQTLLLSSMTFKFDLEFDTSSHLYNETFNKLCSVSLEVLQRQLTDFFDDGYFEGSLPHEVHEILKN